jgi:replicative DNA helicase
VTAATLGQHPPVGPHPVTGVLLIGGLMWLPPADAAEVVAAVLDDDMPTLPLSTVLAAVRRLVSAGTPAGPALVIDELRRAGRLDRVTANHVQDAATSGAQPGAVRSYAAAVLAEALRRRIDSAGTALTAAAADAAEADLAPLVTRAAESVRDCADRLTALRGGIW